MNIKNIKEVDEIVNEHKLNPEKRYGQKKLAEVLLSKYCDESSISQCAYHSENYNNQQLTLEFFNYSSKTMINNNDVYGLKLSQFILNQNIAQSKTQIKRLIETGSVKINNTIISKDKILDDFDIFESKFMLIQTGKTKKHIFQINNI